MRHDCDPGPGPSDSEDCGVKFGRTAPSRRPGLFRETARTGHPDSAARRLTVTVNTQGVLARNFESEGTAASWSPAHGSRAYTATGADAGAAGVNVNLPKHKGTPWAPPAAGPTVTECRFRVTQGPVRALRPSGTIKF
jgi:hypothetical protein